MRKRFVRVSKQKNLLIIFLFGALLLLPQLFFVVAPSHTSAAPPYPKDPTNAAWINAATILYEGALYVDEIWDSDYEYRGTRGIFRIAPSSGYDFPDRAASISTFEQYLSSPSTTGTLDNGPAINIEGQENGAIFFTMTQSLRPGGVTYDVTLTPVFKDGKYVEKRLLHTYYGTNDGSGSTVYTADLKGDDLSCDIATNGEPTMVDNGGSWTWNLYFAGGLTTDCIRNSSVNTTATLAKVYNPLDFSVNPDAETPIADLLPDSGEWKNVSTISYDWNGDGVPNSFIDPSWDSENRYHLGGNTDACYIDIENFSIGATGSFEDRIRDTQTILNGITPTIYYNSDSNGSSCGGNGFNKAEKDIVLNGQPAANRWFVRGSDAATYKSVWLGGGGNEADLIGNYVADGAIYKHDKTGGCNPDTLNVGSSTWAMLVTSSCQPHTVTLQGIAYESQEDFDATVAGITTGPTEALEDTAPTCESSTKGALGWIMCAGVRLIVSVVEFFTGMIRTFLKVSPVVTANADGSPTTLYSGWSVMKNLSLVFLVVAALVAVFGQSLGVEAYTVKKMLPRVLMASIAVLLSFTIVAILVDIFNILGFGINNLLLNSFGSEGLGIEVDFASFVVATLGTLTGLVAGGGAAILWVAGAGAAGGSTILIFVLIPLVLGVLGVVFTLIFRQILIIALVIAAPLAFVAWTLPNTEKYFKLWFDTLIKALLMYPLIMLLLVSGQIFAGIITSADNANPVNLMIGLVAIAVPLFLIPFTFKYAGSAIAGVNAGIKNLTTKGSEAIKGDKQDPNSKRNLLKDQRIQNRSQFGGGSGKLARLSRSKALGNIQGLGSTNRRQMLAEARGLATAQQTMEQIAKSPNSKVLDAMIYDGHGGPPIVTGFDEDGNAIWDDAPMASEQDQASAKRLLKDPYMKAEAFAMAVDKQAGSEATLLHTLERGAALGTTGRENASAMKRPQKGKMGMGSVSHKATMATGDAARGIPKHVVYDWDKSAYSWSPDAGTKDETKQDAKNTLDRQAAAHKLIMGESDISSWEMSQHKPISFEAMSNFVTSDADKDFGYDGSGVMQSRIDKVKEVAYGSYTEYDESGEPISTSSAPPDTQAAALAALKSMQAHTEAHASDRDVVYDYSRPPSRVGGGGGGSSSGGSTPTTPTTPAAPRIITPSDPGYTPPSSGDLPK